MSVTAPTPEQRAAVAALDALGAQYHQDPVVDAAPIDGAATTACQEDYAHGWAVVASGRKELCLGCACAEVVAVAEDPHRARPAHLAFDVLETPPGDLHGVALDVLRANSLPEPR